MSVKYKETNFFDVATAAMRKDSKKAVTVNGSSRALYGYYIGGEFCLGEDHREIPVCVDAFRLVYHLSVGHLSTLHTEIREVSNRAIKHVHRMIGSP